MCVYVYVYVGETADSCNIFYMSSHCAKTIVLLNCVIVNYHLN